MNREFHKWHSPALGREMEMLVFGRGGNPILVFPTSMGRFFEYEDRGMITAVQEKVEGGEIQAYCVDSVDAESWYNKQVHPTVRIARHLQYEQYLLHEVVPFIQHRSASWSFAVTGCSFGGYHAVNFTMKHPALISTCVSMSGAFDVHQFLDGYWDQDCYFNCPPSYLPNLSDDWYLSRYRSGMKLVLAAGEHDICLADNLRLSEILSAKSIPHTLDIWRDGTAHDWPWWQSMARKYF